MRLRASITLAAAASLLAAGTASAQDTGAAGGSDGPHLNSLSVQINASPTIGLWRRFSPRVEAGLEVFARHEKNSYGEGPAAQEARSTTIGVGPALKLYTADAGDLRPYVFASAGVAFTQSRTESPDQGGGTSVNEGDGTSFNAALGVGLQWSPIPRVSIGGHAGIEANRGEGTTQFGPGIEVDVEGHTVGTFTSGLRVHFYF